MKQTIGNLNVELVDTIITIKDLRDGMLLKAIEVKPFGAKAEFYKIVKKLKIISSQKTNV